MVIPQIEVALNPPHFERLPPVLVNRNQIIKKIALQSITEFTISLTIATLVASFSSFGASLIFGIALIQCTTNLFFRTIGLFAAQKARENRPFSEIFTKIAQGCSILTPFNFMFGTAMNGQTLVHESGHALAAYTVYKGTPKIEILPFIGGSTSFSPNQLTSFGEKLGANRSLALVTVAGSLLSLSVSAMALTTAMLVQDKHPTASKYLLIVSLADFIIHATYALSALGSSVSHTSHDFVRLSTFGIHPLVAAISILALPILISCGVKMTQRSLSLTTFF